MAMSPEEALSWVQERWNKDAPCEACGHSDWGVSEAITIGVNVWAAGFPVGKDGNLTLIPVLCRYCGNTRFLNETLIRSDRIRRAKDAGQG